MTDTPAPRNRAIDGLKFLAAISIVIHHVAAKSLDMSILHEAGWVLDYVTYWGLTFFFMVSGYLHGAVGRRGAEWRKRRAARLLGPYVVWSAFYVGFSWVWPQILPVLDSILTWQPHALPPFPDVDLVYVVFFAGACNVLWYLPVLLAIALLADVAIVSNRSRSVALALAVVATVVTRLVPLTFDGAYMWGFYYSAPMWFVVYVLGMSVAARKPVVAPPRLPMEAAALGAVLATGIIPIVPALMSGHLAGLGWLASSALNILASWILLRGASAGADPFSVSRVSSGGPLILGIYAVHTAWIVTWSLLGIRFPMPAGIWMVAGTAFAVGGSVATAAVLRKVPWLRWAIG